MFWLIYILLLIAIPAWGQDSTVVLADHDKTIRYQSGSSYAESRNAETGNLLAKDDFVGDWTDGELFHIHRRFMRFDLTGFNSDTMQVDSIKINVYPIADQTSRGESFHIFIGTWVDTAALADFNSFTGWVAGSNPYTPTFLVDSLYKASWAVNTWHSFHSTTSAQADTVESKLGSYLKAVLSVSKDINGDTVNPAAYERIEIAETNSELVIYYTLVEGGAVAQWKITNARGNIIHEARGKEVRRLLGRDVNKKVINSVRIRIKGL